MLSEQFQPAATNKSCLLKRHFSEDLIQTSGNGYCTRMQRKLRAIPKKKKKKPTHQRKPVINLSTLLFILFFLLAFKS